VSESFFADEESLGFSPSSLSRREACADFLGLFIEVKSTHLLAVPSALLASPFFAELERHTLISSDPRRQV
jgi:hypothetical protein